MAVTTLNGFNAIEDNARHYSTQKLSRTTYGRNLFRVLSKFQVLPTNPDFQALTDVQLDFIVAGMRQEAEDAERARKGLELMSEEWDDGYDPNASVDEWGKDLDRFDDDWSEYYDETIKSMTSVDNEFADRHMRQKKKFELLTSDEALNTLKEARESDSKHAAAITNERLNEMVNREANSTTYTVQREGYEPEDVGRL